MKTLMASLRRRPPAGYGRHLLGLVVAMAWSASSLAEVSPAAYILPQVTFSGTGLAGHVPLHGQVIEDFHFHRAPDGAEVYLGLGNLTGCLPDLDDEAALTMLSSSGFLSLDILLPQPALAFGFGFGMLLSPYTRGGTYVPVLLDRASITAHAGDLTLGTLTYDAHAEPGELYHGYAALQSTVPFDWVHITVSNTGYQMNPGGRPMVGVDNFGIVPVPEPGTAALTTAGSLLLVWRLWRHAAARRGTDDACCMRS